MLLRYTLTARADALDRAARSGVRTAVFNPWMFTDERAARSLVHDPACEAEPSQFWGGLTDPGGVARLDWTVGRLLRTRVLVVTRQPWLPEAPWSSRDRVVRTARVAGFDELHAGTTVALRAEFVDGVASLRLARFDGVGCPPGGRRAGSLLSRPWPSRPGRSIRRPPVGPRWWCRGPR